MENNPLPETSNPWQTHKSRKVYENPWISVREDRVTNPGGGQGIYGVVHFKNKAVGIIPLDEHLNTWIIGQYRYALEEYSWEIPMGGCPEDQSVLEAAKRELREEAGLRAEKWDEIMKLHTSNSVTDETAYVFIARELHFEATDFEETEDLLIRKVPFKELLKMSEDGKITDAISVAGILRLQRMLENGTLQD